MINQPKKFFIKFAWRRNLIYPIQLLIWTVLRNIIEQLLNSFFYFSKTLLFTILMFLGEFLAGLILFIYQKSFTQKKTTQLMQKMVFFRTQTYYMEIHDSKYKIVFLIFISSFFDFVEFILFTYYLPRYYELSYTLGLRLGGILTISSALFFYYLLKFPIFRHQVFSLLIIGICLILVLVSEFCFQDINIFLSYEEFGITIAFIFAVHFFNSLMDSIEKYIIEFSVVNYFGVLALEGLFGLLITFAFSISDFSFLEQISKVYSKNTTEKFAVFILLLFSYLFVCGGRNAFRVKTNKIYSPMTKTLTDYFLNPVTLTYTYFVTREDFVSNGKQNLFYYLINLILSIIISLCGCVYNVIIILFFCGLERDTHNQVSFRSNLFYKQKSEEILPSEKDETEEDIDSDTSKSRTFELLKIKK